MKASKIRQKFNEFFIQNGHDKISSSSLIPENDPTLLFANAGMNQFKNYFTGKAKPKNPSITIKPANIFKMLCPANIFAHRRTDKLIGLKI